MRIPALSIIAVLFVVAASACTSSEFFATADQNPPWFPSLMAFEHYDSERTHLFEQARFGGSDSGRNKVDARLADAVYPSGYNMVYLNPHEVFLYGGGYGNVPNSTGAFVAKVDPDTLRPIWNIPLIDTAVNGEWDYPGVVAILSDGFLYVIYGHRLAKIDPRIGELVAPPVVLPTGQGLPENTSFNGFDALTDGTLIAKTVYREAGCNVQGPTAILPPSMGGCPNPASVPKSILVSIDPRTLQVLDEVQLQQIVAGRPTTTRFRGNDYVYFATTVTSGTTAYRYLIQNGKFYQDNSWNPGILPGQIFGTAAAIMNDWFVVQSNTLPATAPLTVVAINQADATKQFSVQPFKGFLASLPQCETLPAGTVSFAPMSVSVDPDHNLIYAADSVPGAIGALELTPSGFRTLWTTGQRTTEFLALIGPRGRRVLVDTDIPNGQCPLENNTDDVVWRNGQTGDELARTEEPLPVMTSGTMIQPYYFGKMFYVGLNGELIELAVEPAGRH